MVPRDPDSGTLPSCPFIQTISNQIYPIEVYLCNSPTWQGQDHAPSVGRLMAHCLDGCDYASCPHYRRARSEHRESAADILRRRR